MNQSNKTNISVQQLENDKKQLLEYIFESNSQLLKYSKYAIVNDSNFITLNVEELINFLKKASPTNKQQLPQTPIGIITPPTQISPTSSHTSSTPSPPIHQTLNHSLIKSPPPPLTQSTSSLSNSTIINNNEIKSILPENYGILSKEQFHFASYETYLLINHFSSKSNDPISQEDQDSFRIQNEISKVKHDGFIKALTPPTSSPTSSSSSSTQPAYSTLSYRLWILKSFNFNLFDSQESLVIWFRRQLYLVLQGITNIIKVDPFDERDNPTVNQLKLYCYNLEISFQQTPTPTNCLDPIYSTPYNNLISFINNLSPIKSMSTTSATTGIPYQFSLNTNIFEDLLFYSLFEFDEDEIKFIGDEHFRVPIQLKSLAVSLKISSTMESICHLNCFLIAYQSETCQPSHFKRLQSSLNILHKTIENTPSLFQDQSTNSGPLLKATLRKIATWLVKLLSDVHCYRGNDGTPGSITKDIASACQIYVQSREMWSCLSSNKTPIKTTESNFSSFITSSVSCHYSRIAKSYHPLSLDNFSDFIKELIPEIQSNISLFIMGFQNFHSKCKFVALSEWVNLYSADLKIVFADVYFLSPMLLHSVQSASKFQTMLEKFNLIEPENLPPIKLYVSSVIGTWCQNQEKDFSKWFDNIFKLDNFTSLDKDVKHSSSVVDMFTMFYQTISTLAKMKGSLSDNFPAFILTLSALFNSNCLLQYNTSIENLTMCNQKQSILFPTSLNERIQNKSKIRKSISTSSNQLSSSIQSTISKPSVPDPVQTVINTKLQSMPLSKLCICVNNLDYILLNINTYINEHSFDNETLRGKLKELFSTTQITITDTLKQLVDFIGARVVFYECKQTILESLYVGGLNSKQDRISEILESTSPHLKIIYNSTHSVDRGNDILASVCRAFLQSIEFSILYSSTNRYFQPKDAELIEYDLELVKDFFLDRDEQGNATAVSDELFESYVGPLRKLAQLLMDLSTDILIEQYDTSNSGFNNGGNGNGNGGKLKSNNQSSFSKEIILCILIHRNDKPARSFIKKKLNDNHFLSIKKNSKINFLT